MSRCCTWSYTRPAFTPGGVPVPGRGLGPRACGWLVAAVAGTPDRHPRPMVAHRPSVGAAVSAPGRREPDAGSVRVARWCAWSYTGPALTVRAGGVPGRSGVRAGLWMSRWCTWSYTTSALTPGGGVVLGRGSGPRGPVDGPLVHLWLQQTGIHGRWWRTAGGWECSVRQRADAAHAYRPKATRASCRTRGRRREQLTGSCRVPAHRPDVG